MPRSSWWSRPAAVGTAIVALLAARWIWVAGLGDYGWDYEVAARLLRGEIFYRDFVLTRGPLSYYTLAGMMRLLGPHLFVYHLHVWFSYLLCMSAGLLVARELGASPSAQITGLSFAAVVACPAFTWGHAIDYQSVFVAGLATLFTLYAHRRSPCWTILAGAAAALCIFDKQNVGIAIAVSIPLFLRRKSLGIYAAGFAGVFLAAFACFSWRAGAEEVWRQLFSDAVASKGGLLVTAGRAIPRLIFRPNLAYRRWWELAATAAIYTALLPLVIGLTRRRPAEPGEERSSFRLGLACLVGAGLAVAVSLLRLDIPVPQNLLIHPWSLLLQLSYIFFFLLSAAHVLRHRDWGWTAALALVLAVVAAQEASNPNFVYSAALVLPVLWALLARLQVTLRPSTAGVLLAAVYLAGTTGVGPISFRLRAYQPTYALPSGSPFAGLRAPADYSQWVNESWQQVRPILKSRKTLWLLGGGGPYLAFGGAPVLNAPYWTVDSFSLRLDERLIRSWQTDPAEVVLLRDDFQASPRSQVLTAGYIKEHVLSESAEIWRSKIDPRVGLWLRRPVVATPPAPARAGTPERSSPPSEGATSPPRKF